MEEGGLPEEAGAGWGLQDAGFPEINIICEKVAAEGMTRFEDRYKLPVGISVNMASWSAKMMTHVGSQASCEPCTSCYSL